jgi:hypothetical protein
MNTTTEETKQIIFEGLTYTVPTWVKWVAKDEDLTVWGYKGKPHCRSQEWSPEEPEDEAHLVTTLDDSWDDSLTEV